MKVHQLLDKDSWVKGAGTLDKDNRNVMSYADPRACKWCLVSAIARCYSRPDEVLLKLARDIVVVVGVQNPVDIIVDYNDGSCTWDQVQERLVRLDI